MPNATKPLFLTKTLPANVAIRASVPSIKLVDSVEITNGGSNPILIAASKADLFIAANRFQIAGGATETLPVADLQNLWAISVLGSSVTFKGQRVNDLNITGAVGKRFRQDVVLGATNIASTYCAIVNAPRKNFTHARVLFANQEATPGVISGLIASVTNNGIADIVTPSVGNTVTNDGGLTGWQTGTFDGATGVTLPAAGADIRHPGTLFSDWIPLKSVDQIDGTKYPYAMFRVNYSATFTIIQPDATNTQLTNKNRACYAEFYRSNSTDAIAVPSVLTAANKVASNSTPFYGFEFIDISTGETFIEVLCGGDSITDGTGSTLSFDNWLSQANEMFYDAAIPINLTKVGLPGQTTANFSTALMQAIDQHMPGAVAYSAFSPNNYNTVGSFGYTQAEIMFQDALKVKQYCDDRDILLIFTFLAPYDTYNVADYNAIAYYRKRIASLGCPIVDMYPAVSAGTSPDRYAQGLTPDGIHPTTEGYRRQSLIAFEQFPVALRARIG